LVTSTDIFFPVGINKLLLFFNISTENQFDLSQFDNFTGRNCRDYELLWSFFIIYCFISKECIALKVLLIIYLCDFATHHFIRVSAGLVSAEYNYKKAAQGRP